jgi:mannose-6-phosphate isomerase-like protein (cupin superfamily)
MERQKSGVQRVCFGDADERRLTGLLRHQPIELATEQVGTCDFLHTIISKPWGREYRIYADHLFDVWKLDILAGQATSLHCHPRKETMLLCLSGQGRLRFLAGTTRLSPPDIYAIGRGVVHATENSAEVPLELIEVEVPRNKLDLIRVEDRYGRSGAPYETRGKVSDPESCLVPLDEQIAGAMLRRVCPERRYRFAVERGEALLALAKGRHLHFAIALDAVHAIRQEIQALPTASIGAGQVGKQSWYLVIMDAECSEEGCAGRRKGDLMCIECIKKEKKHGARRNADRSWVSGS